MWGTNWSSISAFKFKNDGTTIKITKDNLDQNLGTAGTRYTSSTGYIFYNDSQFYGTSATAGAALGNNAIASFTVVNPESSATYVSALKLFDNSSAYTFSIEGTSITLGLSGTNDNIVLGDSGNITNLSVNQGGGSGVDTISFANSTGKEFVGVKSSISLKSGNLIFQNADATTVFKLDEKSMLTSISVANNSGKIFVGSSKNEATTSVSLFGSSKGTITLDLQKATNQGHIGTWDIEGGTFNLTSGKTSISNLSASGGKFILGTKAVTIGAGSTLTELTTAASTGLFAGTKGVVNIQDLSINSLSSSAATSFSIDLSKSTVTTASSIDVKDMKANAFAKLNGKAALNLDLGTVADGKYFIVSDSLGTSAIASIHGGSNMVVTNPKLSELNISAATTADSVTDWNIKDMKGNVSVIASAGADKVTIGAANVTSGVVSLGAGNDTINFGTTSDRPSANSGKVSVVAGKGDDVFDISGYDPTTEGKKVYVSDFGSGLSKNSELDSDKGYDKIFIGNMALNASNVTVKSGTVNTSAQVIVVNGVEFDVTGNENGYVQIGTGSSIANAKWTTYNMTSGGLVTVESAGADIESLTAGESYNAVDTVSTAFTDESRSKESTVTISDTASVASAINESLAAATSDKYLEVGSQKFDDTIDMGSNGNNIIEFGSGSKATGNINKGTSAGTIAFTDSTVDLSDVSIKGFNSTKDTMVANVNLDQYLTSSVTSGFADSLGAYGGDVVADNGSLKATTVSGGLYKTNFREAVVQNGKIVATNNEIAVVTGAAEGAKGNFGAEKTAVFAILDNNGDAADTVTGSANNDVFVLGKGDSVNGGEGDDLIAMKGNDATVVLASGKSAGNDTVIGLAEGVGTLKLAGTKTADSLSVTFNGDGGFTLTSDTVSSSRFVNTQAGENAVDGVFNTKIADKNNTYDAMLINTAGTDPIVLDANAVKGTDLFVGSADGTALVDFGNTDKTLIHLASSDPDDTTTYSNIRYVKASNKGGSQLYGGGNAASTLVAGGTNDSLWGGLERQKDSLVSASGETTFFGSTKDSGQDTIANFQFGTGTGADVLILMDGTDNSTFKVSNDAVIVGSSDKDNLTIQNEGHDGVVDIQFRLGTESTIVSAARADTGDGTINFDDDIAWYLGQGTSTILDLGKGAVTLGYQSGNGSINVGTLDGRNTAAGSIINGGMENANVVYASENGASSISGAFDGNWAESYDDTLVGGGNGETMFYVGKDMGNDVINNLTDGDKIVFLGTKIGDITNDLKTLSGNSFNVEFGDSSKVVVNTATDVSNLKNVTIYFDDKQADWNGSGWNVHDKN